jgi:hypothetical protein
MDTQQHNLSESESGLQRCETLDNHGVNPTDGPTRLPTHSFGPARGQGGGPEHYNRTVGWETLG